MLYFLTGYIRGSIPYNIHTMKLLFGIGNPGKEYEGTRHNIGIAFVSRDEVFKDVIKEVSDVFVNRSGQIVKKLKSKFKIKNENIYVVHDDLDIQFGEFKIVFNRGSAGHRGVQSVIAALKTQKFWRVRIGTSSPRLRSARAAKDKKEAVADFVLSKFTSGEKKQLEDIFERISHAISDHFNNN